MMSFQVKATSAAVSGVPSLQRRFLRSRNVQVLPSGELVHSSASPGSTSCEGQSNPSNEANIKRTISSEDCSFSVMGLNVLGSVNEATTSRPPGLPGGQ